MQYSLPPSPSRDSGSTPRTIPSDCRHNLAHEWIDLDAKAKRCRNSTSTIDKRFTYITRGGNWNPSRLD